ncbi:hypothetical protein ACFSQJ_08925 [Croceitalea marina]|uniref:DUF4468 domain-containing protein n=1 Tax=Croceitalea marina TaxID=1775166 RepID=A0ABW5MUY3_9FLAO
MKKIFLLYFLLLSSLTFGQKNTVKEVASDSITELNFPKEISLKRKFRKQIEEKKRGFYRIYNYDTITPKNHSVEFLVDKIENDKEYSFVFDAEYLLAFNYTDMIPKLIELIINNKEVGLINTSDLIIWERIQSGDLKSYGHGGIVQDDLFKVSGRANHLLKEITGEDFGIIRMNTKQTELKEIQDKWIKWLKKL